MIFITLFFFYSSVSVLLHLHPLYFAYYSSQNTCRSQRQKNFILYFSISFPTSIHFTSAPKKDGECGQNIKNSWYSIYIYLLYIPQPVLSCLFNLLGCAEPWALHLLLVQQTVLCPSQLSKITAKNFEDK